MSCCCYSIMGGILPFASNPQGATITPREDTGLVGSPTSDNVEWRPEYYFPSVPCTHKPEGTFYRKYVNGKRTEETRDKGNPRTSERRWKTSRTITNPSWTGDAIDGNEFIALDTHHLEITYFVDNTVLCKQTTSQEDTPPEAPKRGGDYDDSGNGRSEDSGGGFDNDNQGGAA